MATAVFDRLTYVSVLIYLVYIVAEGWNRLPPIF